MHFPGGRASVVADHLSTTCSDSEMQYSVAMAGNDCCTDIPPVRYICKVLAISAGLSCSSGRRIHSADPAVLVNLIEASLSKS